MVQKIYRPKAVIGLFGFSMATLYDQISKKEFPAPNIQIGLRAVGWTEDVLEKEQARRIAQRDAVVSAGRAA